MKKIIFMFFGLIIFTSCSSAKQYNKTSSPMQTSATMEKVEYESAESVNDIDGGDMIKRDNREDLLPGSAIDSKPEYSNSTKSSNKKIIINSYMDIETLTFTETSDEINKITEESGGYIENSIEESIYYSPDKNSKYLNIVIKIPVEKFDEAKNKFNKLGKVLRNEQSSEDMSNEYFDINQKLKLLKTYEQKWLDLLVLAKEVEDVIELEKNLGETRTEIELYESQINNIDRLSSFSTITISLTEVFVESISVDFDNFGYKAKNAFISSINFTINFFELVAIFIAKAFVPLIFIGVFGFFLRFVVKNKKIKK